MINNWNLNNGAKLVIEDIPYVKSAAVGVYIKIGSRYETSSLAGASHFLEHMLFKGTPRRSARDIAETMEGMGGQLNAYTGKEYTCVYARALDEDIYAAMEIVFDMLLHSTMEPKEFDTERSVIMEEINMYEDTPDELIHDIFARKFWDGDPMGNSILGTAESITGMNRDELYRYYKKYYVPANFIVAVAGNVDTARIKDFVEAKLNECEPAASLTPLEQPAKSQPFVNLVAKDVEQIQISLGVPGLSYRDENRYTQNVMNSILGGGMSSRLFQKLREELGLAYSVYTYPASYSDTGLFSFYIGTSASRVPMFCAALSEQLQLFVDKGVSREEINRTQKLMKSSISLGLESVMNRMTRLGKSILMYDQVVPPEEIIARVYAVEPDMVQQMAQNLFKPELFSIAAIGSDDALPIIENQFNKWWGSK
ncbi:MAG: pitrilysin family protein [Syntrophomonadaceae bacterium]|nr:pitrilysin family protein [Syntrophomonadaceae bacterium]